MIYILIDKNNKQKEIQIVMPYNNITDREIEVFKHNFGLKVLFKIV